MMDRMSTKIKMLSNGFVFVIAHITFVSVYLLPDTISSFSTIYTVYIYSFGIKYSRE